MSEFKVSITLQAVTVSAVDANEALTTATAQIITDGLRVHASKVEVTKLDRITVPGFRK